MRIVCISDTHGLHPKMKHPLPEGDILIHAGDCTNVGKEHEIGEFITWFKNIEGFQKKIFIAGNHDFGFERKGAWLPGLIDKDMLNNFNCVYLEDQEFLIEHPDLSRPLKVYGSPWQPRFYDWAFNVDRDKIHVYWEKIPRDSDIIITHGPVYGMLDLAPIGGRVGCNSLRFHVEQIKPKLHVSGHIHCGYGVELDDNTIYVNASICDEKYRPINKPIIIDITEVYGEIITSYVEE